MNPRLISRCSRCGFSDEDLRTNQQNDLMWARLTDIAQQVVWPVDGRLQYLSADDWKEILSASLKKHQRVAQGTDGGFVILGARTSRMSKALMSELLELIAAFGIERNVQFKEAA